MLPRHTLHLVTSKEILKLGLVKVHTLYLYLIALDDLFDDIMMKSNRLSRGTNSDHQGSSL